MNTHAYPIARTLQRSWLLLIIGALVLTASAAVAQFVHPGGLHNQADLDRMRAQVAAGAQPWKACWDLLITDSQAQTSYNPAPQGNMGVSRQRASQDAHAAYLNAIRGYVSNDMAHIDKAISICNAWSAAVNQVPTGTDIPGLSGIPIGEFAIVGEILRIYVPTRWATADFNRFKAMMLNYWYPVCDDFLRNHNGSCISNYWANWDAANIAAVMAIGILCDDQAKFDQARNYFQSGAGMGSIMNAVPFLHAGGLGQWQESGRDQPHAMLGIGLLGVVCEMAWKQGIDLYGYSSNRLLAGAEYTAQYNLWKSVPYTTYNNCQPANNKWVSINGRSQVHDRPMWELIYNHYVGRRGLSAPNTTAMAKIVRPERGSADHFGYGTLTFTLAASAYPPSPTPPAPTGLTATAGVGRVWLSWSPAAGDTAQGYEVRRATSSGGPYTSIASWNNSPRCVYTDTSVTNGTTYYYVVASRNQSGTSGNSAQVSATPAATGALPSGWTRTSIGTVSGAAAGFANVSGGTYVVAGSGTIGGTADAVSFVHRSVTGDATITARISSLGGTVQKSGIMMRESTAANARTVSMTLGDAGWRFARLGTRANAGDTMGFTLGNAYTWVPAWFRISRVGNVFTAYESSDGLNWFTVGSATIAMPTTYVLGMAISSGGTAVNNTTFDNVTVTGGGGVFPAAGTYKLVSRTSGLRLDNLGSTADGADVAQWQDSASNNQRWVLSYVSSNVVKLQCVTGGKFLDGMGRTSNGSIVGQWGNNASTNQRWTIIDVGGGYFKLKNLATGLCLDVGASPWANSDPVEQWGDGSSQNQHWQFIVP
jgi:hypothetical protein